MTFDDHHSLEQGWDRADRRNVQDGLFRSRVPVSRHLGSEMNSAYLEDRASGSKWVGRVRTRGKEQDGNVRIASSLQR